MKKKAPKHIEKLTPEQQLQEKPDSFLIVGICASAGGIKALQEFFRHVPDDSGMAYVVILHLSPDHDSQLAAVLQRETKLPVAQVTEKTIIKTDHIYVVPPDRHLTMDDGYIAVSPNVRMEERMAPVDIFFRTLADQHGPRAVSVILSGTGANGSMGLKRVKERGGAAFVQNPREAEFNEMPRNAIETELIDDILNVSEIPGKIIAYRNNTGTVQITVEAEQRPEDQQQALREIFTLLRHRTGHDFSNYKRPTLLRRIERRISVRNLPDLPAYAKFLQENGEEPHALLKDLLISVTNFFRDRKAFEAVEQEIIPLLLKDKNADHQVRIWVAGCATGEEAYSFAMLCLERTIGLLDAPKVQIFATDIDEGAVSQAREGVYTINDLADVSQERLRRFFNREGDAYRIRREVRETVMFATHNFLKDPPFSHLDLVSCRNVMIYLNQVAQERVAETFHFALRPGGFLFLGNSESVDGASDLYASYSREHHIYQSRQVTPRAYPVPESTPVLHFDKFKKDQVTQERENKILERISFGDLHQQLLEEYAPPSLVVNEEYDILHLTERAGKYLQIGGGELSQNLLKLIKPALRLELRSALYQAVQHQSAVEARGLKVTVGDDTETINVQVRPVLRSGDTAKGFILIVFEPSADDNIKEVLLASDEPVARQLEDELIKVKAHLRAANEQHDFQAEEMKASNEELQAMNEELRSAAEELETSKEELQSINEELRTVNQELKVKIEETSIAGNNLQNLINSTNIGTIFLDRSFRVVLFTPAIREIFNLRSADYGRPLSDITGNLEYEYLLSDAETVLEKLLEFEKEVSTKNGGAYLMRITPYRTDEDRIKGVVITFLDITQRKKADEALRISEHKYRTLFDSIDEGVATMELIFDEEGRATDWLYLEHNPALAKLTGLSQHIVGKKASDIYRNLEPFWMETFGRVVRSGVSERFEYSFADLGNRWFDVYAARVGGSGSRQLVIVYNNITERKQDEEKQRFLLNLIDILRPLSDPEAVQGEVTRLARHHFKLDRCYYCEVDGDNIVVRKDSSAEGLPTIKGSYFIPDMPVFMEVIAQGKPMVVPDIHTFEPYDESLRQTVIALQLIAFIIIPVIKDGQPAGLLCFVQSQPREWTNSEVDIAADIADRTWAAVERAKAEAALGLELADTQQLQHISSQIIQEDNIEKLYSQLIDAAMTIMHSQAASLQMYVPDKEALLLLASKGFTPEAAAYWHWITPASSTTCSTALNLVQRCIIPDIESPEFKTEPENLHYYRICDIKSIQSTPLVSRNGNIVGMISTHWRDSYTPSDRELRMLDVIARQAADLIERRQVEAALRENERRLQRMVNVPKVGVLTFDYSERMLSANDAFLEMVGYDREDFEKGQFTWRDFTPQEHLEASVDVIKQLETTGVGGPYEKEYYRKDGSKVWMMFVAADMGDGTLVEYAVDVSERKAAEEALRKSEERLQLATHAANMGTFIYYPGEDRGEPDQQMLTLFGLPLSAKLNLSEALGHIIHPDDREKYANEVGKAIDPAGEGRLNSDIRIILSDGTVRWINIFAQTHFAGDPPQPVKMPGVAIDITERKLAQQTLQEFNLRLEQEVADRTFELRENYTLLQTIYDTTLIGMSVFAPVRDAQGSVTDFRIVMVNKKVERTAGRKDMIGKLYSELFPGIRQVGLFALMVQTMETGKSGKMEYHYKYEGIDNWYSTMFVKGGDLLVSTNLDITNRVRAEDERFRNYILLQQSEELAQSGSWDYDLLTGAFAWSDGMYRLFNLEKGTEIRPEIYLQYATEDCKDTAGRIVRHIEQGDVSFEETIHIRVGEDIKVVKIKADVVKNNKGKPVRVLGVDMDVTATRAAEEKMRRMESEQQLEIFRATLRTQEEERRRISESLHNGLGQMLYGIKISLNQLSIKRATEKPEDFETAKRYTNELLSDAISDSRRISHELMPAVLDEYGLKAAVREICQQMQGNVKFRCSVDLDELQIDKYMQLAIFRTVQELMINVVKHAEATKAKVEIKYQHHRIIIGVADNGKGMTADQQGKDGIGLTSIRSKAGLLDGSVDIQSSPEKGTTISVLLPYNPVITK